MLILSRKAGQSIIIQLDRALPWKTPASALFAGGPICWCCGMNCVNEPLTSPSPLGREKYENSAGRTPGEMTAGNQIRFSVVSPYTG